MNRSIQDKLTALRALMVEQGIDAYLVPRADEFQNEFAPPYAERLRYLTGFTGSAGLAIITANKSILMTDARYTLQAATECPDFEIIDSADQAPSDYLSGMPGVVGFDPFLHTVEQINRHHEKGVSLKPVTQNLIDQIWTDSPDRIQANIIDFPAEIAGRTTDEKIALIRKEMGDLDAFVFTAPDSTSWLQNIRGDEVPCVPSVLRYTILTKTSLHNCDSPRAFHMYASVCNGLKTGIDFKHTPLAVKEALEQAGAEIEEHKDPCIEPKAIKTPQEKKSIRAAHVKDGVALVKFLHWFSTNNDPITECGISEKLEEFRREDPAYKQPSFPTIAGFGSNGAIIHYRPTKEADKAIKGDSLLLIDSGGQYAAGNVWGTTDVTRTIAIGNPTDEMKENFTRVLKGHIALATAKFDKYTPGKQLDELARAPLKEAGLNYGHGTGHGVGCYLSVHEEAASISPRGEEVMKPGMLVSNEPGYYKEGSYGIRTESLILCHDDFTFETVTLCPIDQSLIAAAMLNADEKSWLNAYHERVQKELSSFLSENQKAWLATATKAIN